MSLGPVVFGEVLLSSWRVVVEVEGQNFLSVFAADGPIESGDQVESHFDGHFRILIGRQFLCEVERGVFGVEGNVDVLLGGGGVFVVISSHKVYACSTAKLAMMIC